MFPTLAELSVIALKAAAPGTTLAIDEAVAERSDASTLSLFNTARDNSEPAALVSASTSDVTRKRLQDTLTVVEEKLDAFTGAYPSRQLIIKYGLPW